MLKQMPSFLPFKHGLSALPAIPGEKRPALPGWREYQKRLPTEAEARRWFARAAGVCLVCGAVSGNLEMIDFDNKGEMFTAWWEKVEAARPGLFERLVVEQTPSGGYHVAYRSAEPVPGNQRLAQRAVPCNGPEEVEIAGKRYVPRPNGDHWEVTITLIETRGEGGLFLCDPTPGYSLQQGEFANLPTLSTEERALLIDTARSLNELHPSENSGSVSEANHSRTIPAEPVDRPGDEFNARADIRPLLIQHGWVRVRDGDNEHWRRPGKDTGTSATLKDGVFYVFSSSVAPFEPDKGYSPFQVYALLEHGGDFTAAARELRESGFGDEEGDLPQVDLSSFLANIPDPPAPVDEAEAQPLAELFESVTELDPPLIHGLLREGETMNVIASSKTGKSWLVMRLAISIASGLDWFGMPVEHGRVLHIDNELRLKTIVHRYRKIADALKVPGDLFSHNLDVKSLRGRLKDLNKLGSYFASLQPGKYKAVIIDAFYRTLPIGMDENDNGAIASLYNKLDWYASRLQCAFVLIHHSSKGNQSQKSVTDVGAGAGAQSRAADTHLILRPHEESNVAVLEAAVRSWPPREPMCLRWEFPLWHEARELDPKALLGKAQESRPSKRDWSVEDFIRECVMPHDPCSQNKIVYHAGQAGISEHKARQFITFALNEGLIGKEKVGSKMMLLALRPGFPPGKGQLVAAALDKSNPDSPSKIAEAFEVSDRYIRQMRAELTGGSDRESGIGGLFGAELGPEQLLSNSGIVPEPVPASDSVTH
jgi:hypothetical protein